MGPKTTPSLISKGGYQIPPPPGREGNWHPLGNRVNVGVGHFDTTPEIKKGTVTPHVAKSYFETYKINDHM